MEHQPPRRGARVVVRTGAGDLLPAVIVGIRSAHSTVDVLVFDGACHPPRIRHSVQHASKMQNSTLWDWPPEDFRWDERAAA